MTCTPRVITALLLLSIPPAILQAKERPIPVIRSIMFDQRNVFDPEYDDWFFAAPLANELHSITRQYILEDELLLLEGDEIDSVFLVETERNLRRTGLFSNVRVTYDTNATDSTDVMIYTQDRWSLRPAVLFSTGGGITNIGGKIEEINLFGTATQVMAYGLYRTENEIGWEGMLQVSQRRLFRTEIGFNAALKANQFRTDQFISVTKPFRTTVTPYGFGVSLANGFGKDFAYIDGPTPTLLPFLDRSAFAWLGKGYGEIDRLFISGSLAFSDVQRTIPASRQAFDNTGRLLISFSSLRQTFSRTAFLDGYETEDLQEGAWGNVQIGRVFSLGNGGETMWYIGGTAEQSIQATDKIYLFGQVNGASGFGDGRAKYTYLEVLGLGHWRCMDNFVLTARARTQTAWNWNAFRQLVLDFESGLRGYNANSMSGDNRIISNTELRWFPGWKWWLFGFSTVAFHDMGTVWNQGQTMSQLQFHHAVGVGIRFHNLKAAGSDAIFRFDFAFNLDERRFAGLIFSTNQLFSAFGSHKYKAPDLLGTKLDVQ